MHQLLLVFGLIFWGAITLAGPSEGAGTQLATSVNRDPSLFNGDHSRRNIVAPADRMELQWDSAYQRGLRLWNEKTSSKEGGETLLLLRRAAENGHAPSQNLLGSFYDKGKLVERNPAMALEWYEKAAAQGLARAQLNAGLMYRAGEGVPRDDAKALRLFEQAAEGNSPQGQYMLALMLEDGVAGERDAQGAVNWYRRAARQGYGPAQHNLAVAYATGSGVAKSEQAAAHWYREAAGNGQAKSKFLLGVMLAEGRGVKRNEAQAYVWLMLAAANGWSDETLRQQATSLAAKLARMLTPEQLAKAQQEIAAKMTSRS